MYKPTVESLMVESERCEDEGPQIGLELDTFWCIRLDAGVEFFNCLLCSSSQRLAATTHAQSSRLKTLKFPSLRGPKMVSVVELCPF